MQREESMMPGMSEPDLPVEPPAPPPSPPQAKRSVTRWGWNRSTALSGAAIAAIILVAVVGTKLANGSSDPESAAPIATAPSVSSTPTPDLPTIDPGPAPTPTPLGAQPEINCSSLDAIEDDLTVTDYREAWSQDFDDCHGEATSGDLTQAELKAVSIGYGNVSDDEVIEDIGRLYGYCAESGGRYVWKDALDDLASPREFRGMLALCPSHPERKTIRTLIAAYEKDAKLRKAGRAFDDGTYRVGKDIKPGTYVVRDADGCYWERTSRSGATIDNFFTNGAKRVQVTIRSSDYGFHSENCGEWKPA